MAPIPATVVALLASARSLLVKRQFDAERVLKLLAALPIGELNVQARGAVRHAQVVAKIALDPCTSRNAVARFALHRVVLLLEEHLVGLEVN